MRKLKSDSWKQESLLAFSFKRLSDQLKLNYLSTIQDVFIRNYLKNICPL